MFLHNEVIFGAANFLKIFISLINNLNPYSIHILLHNVML